MVGTRSCTQIRTHAQKYFIALQKPTTNATESKGRKGGSVGSLSRKSTTSKLLSGGIVGGSYGVSELQQPIHLPPPSHHHHHLSPMKSSIVGSGGGSGSGISKRRKLRLTKGAGSGGSPKLSGLTGIEALARAAETETQLSNDVNYDSLDDAADDLHDTDDRKHGRHHLDANDQPPYEDEADSADGASETGETGFHHKMSPSPSKRTKLATAEEEDGGGSHPSRRKFQRTSSMMGAAASIASLANAPVSTLVAAESAADPSVDSFSVAKMQELEHLRDRMGIANETILTLQQQNREMEIQYLTASEERNRAIADCKTLQEVNAQITAEHRRALILLEQSQMQQSGSAGGGGGSCMSTQQAAEMEARLAADPQIIAAAAANGVSPQELARHHRQQHEQQQNVQNAHVVELLQSQLTEAELRFHQVTESLTRQTQVLTDQHRAILELNDKLEKEKSARLAAEVELNKYRKERSKAGTNTTAAVAIADKNLSSAIPTDSA
jgi:hypothetical protein